MRVYNRALSAAEITTDMTKPVVAGTQPPGDVSPPSVAVSAPADGATVFGTTTPVSANASDDVGVVGVQFTLDGANLGAEDTSAPYSVSWNTTTATDGPHTLRAIARDASGKSTTSAPVGVTVSNANPPTPGLVAAYGFEETSGPTATDSSGQSNPGTLVNGAARTASGKIGRAIDFDGVNDYVSVADANSLDLTTGMTLEAWVQLDTVSSWRTAILKEKPGSDIYALYASNSANAPQGEVITGTGAVVKTGAPPPLTAGTWTHLAVTYDGTTLRVFQNGAQSAAIAGTGSIQTSTGALRIGGNLIWGEYTDGRIDEVRVYNRALSAAEITTDMTKPVVAGTQPPGDVSPPSVAVSAPADGATVFGTTTPVSANASDDVGVVGVQFTLDGANLGAEDTSAPYSVSWNTTTATNGPHTLRAIARDASGNSTTSAPVGVTVSNATPPTPGLVAAYGFEETSGPTVTDSSGQNNAGTIINSAARTAAGKIGRAIDFDGVNDYVSVADANSLDLTTGMTLEAWVQLDTASPWRTAIFKEKPGSVIYDLYATNASNSPQGEVSFGSAPSCRPARPRP